MDSISLMEARKKATTIGKANRAAYTHLTSRSHEQSAPDLSILNEGRRSAPPLPIEVFGPWADWIKATAEGKSAPVDYVAVALLTGAAAVIGNARWVSPWQGWQEPCSIWAALIGKPSSGKSPAIDPVISMMRTMESEMAVSFEDDLRKWQTDMEAAKCSRENWQSDVKTAVKNGTPAPHMPAGAAEPEKPARPRLAVSDTTPEALATILAGQPRGLLSYRDELSGWLGSFDRYGSGSGERGFWLEAYGGRSFVLDRVKLDAPLRIPHLTVSVLGGIQPDKLVSTLMVGDDDGLAARMLFTWPEPVKPARPKSTANDVAALAAMRRLLSLQIATDDDGQPDPLILPMSDAAADLVDQWGQAQFESAEAATGMVAGHFGKMPGLLLRLSLALEHLWWCWSADRPSPAIVSERAVTAAAALLDAYFKPMAERAYGDASLPEADRLAATLARWIIKERPEVINVRNVRRKARLPGLKEAAKVRIAIEALVEACWLFPHFDRDGNGAGRKREDYVVNRAVWEEGSP